MPEGRGPVCLAQSPRRLRALAASAFPADDGVQGDMAHRTPFGVFLDTPDALVVQGLPGVLIAAPGCDRVRSFAGERISHVPGKVVTNRDQGGTRPLRLIINGLEGSPWNRTRTVFS